jgi:hypothetical protein
MKIGAIVSVAALVAMQLLFAAATAEPTTLTLAGAGSSAVAIGAWWRKGK